MDKLKDVLNQKLTTRREANAIVGYSFRNTFLEDLHAGKQLPRKYLKGYSRISQAEMKRLMIEACEKVELLLLMKENEPEKYADFMRLQGLIICSSWLGQKTGYAKTKYLQKAIK